MLLQKLVNTTDDGDLLQPDKRKTVSDRHATLQSLELEYQNHLLEACNQEETIYDPNVIELLLQLLMVDPPFRSITTRVLCSVILHLTFSKRK